MDDTNSLKTRAGYEQANSSNERVFEISKRWDYVRAIGRATDIMIKSLTDYVGRNDRGPELIVIRGSWYQSSECLSRITKKIKDLELTSKVIYTQNGEVGELEFDLDAMADEFLKEGSGPDFS
jgi:hypothetical protein